jgi:hypothetical protein
MPSQPRPPSTSCTSSPRPSGTSAPLRYLFFFVRVDFPFLIRHLYEESTLTMVQSSPGPVIPSTARDLLSFPVSAISLSSPNKSLRHFATSRYNHRVENHAQAPTKAPIFLPQPSDVAVERASFFEPDTPVSHLFSDACTLFKTSLQQPSHYQSLAHSFKNIGGYGVEPLPQRFPFWERHPVPAFASQNVGLCPRSWRHCVQPTSAARHRRNPAVRREIVNSSYPSQRALSIFTCKKKAIYSKLTVDRRKRMESERRLQVNPSHRIDILQEMDR